MRNMNRNINNSFSQLDRALFVQWFWAFLDVQSFLSMRMKLIDNQSRNLLWQLGKIYEYY